LNGEDIQAGNLVIWYVPQAQTDGTAPDYYCWTVQGEPNPETYPCFAGPMFVPFSIAPTAAFTYSEPNLTTVPTDFQNTSFGSGSMSYLWDFGDGSTSSDVNPSYQYPISGTYTVTLTVTNIVGSDTFVDTVDVFQLLLNPPDGNSSPVGLPSPNPLAEPENDN
jgi:PKD repeat protein